MPFPLIPGFLKSEAWSTRPDLDALHQKVLHDGTLLKLAAASDDGPAPE